MISNLKTGGFCSCCAYWKLDCKISSWFSLVPAFSWWPRQNLGMPMHILSFFCWCCSLSEKSLLPHWNWFYILSQDITLPPVFVFLKLFLVRIIRTIRLIGTRSCILLITHIALFCTSAYLNGSFSYKNYLNVMLHFRWDPPVTLFLPVIISPYVP